MNAEADQSLLSSECRSNVDPHLALEYRSCLGIEGHQTVGGRAGESYLMTHHENLGRMIKTAFCPRTKYEPVDIYRYSLARSVLDQEERKKAVADTKEEAVNTNWLLFALTLVSGVLKSKRPRKVLAFLPFFFLRLETTAAVDYMQC